MHSIACPSMQAGGPQSKCPDIIHISLLLVTIWKTGCQKCPISLPEMLQLSVHMGRSNPVSKPCHITSLLSNSFPCDNERYTLREPARLGMTEDVKSRLRHVFLTRGIPCLGRERHAPYGLIAPVSWGWVIHHTGNGWLVLSTLETTYLIRTRHGVKPQT